MRGIFYEKDPITLKIEDMYGVEAILLSDPATRLSAESDVLARPRAGQLGHVIIPQHDKDWNGILNFVLYNISYSIGIGNPSSSACAQKRVAHSP